MTQFVFALPFPEAPAQPAAHAMITDPPYSEHVHKSAVSQAPRGGVRKRDLGFDHLMPEDVARTAGWAARGVSRWSVIYSDVESAHRWREAVVAGGGKYVRTIPWVRWSMPQLSGDRPPTGCEKLTVAWGAEPGHYLVDPGAEDVVVSWGAQAGAKSWNGLGNMTHFEHAALRGEDKHGAEKPLDQLLDLVEFFTNYGEHVVDLYAGSGTTGLACKILGRSFTGYERDAYWAERANERIGRCRIDGGAVYGLSERDEERFRRYLETRAKRETERVRLAENTAKYRARAEKERAARKEAEGCPRIT